METGKQIVNKELHARLPLSELGAVSVCELNVKMRFTRQVRCMLDQGQELFPSIFGLDHVKRRLVEVLMTGHGSLLQGDFGVGKTELARSIFRVLSTYYVEHPIYSPSNCPVRENAVYLYNFLVKNDIASYEKVCPLCRHNHIESAKAVSDIWVERVYLDEGRGFARIQGNEDIEPEKILGMYHLTRYAEIGDPFDPRVLEPGKIAQASGGILFVDEIGLLNKEAQYALIQGLQENHFTPTNSRMTFPVDFLFVSTTNSINEFQIHRAVHNRLVGIRIDRVNRDSEVALVQRELDSTEFKVIFPCFFLEFLVDSMRKLSNITVYLGPRSSIRAAQIAAASAIIERKAVVDYCDVKEGIYAEVLGQADDDRYEESLEMLNKDFLSVSEFLKGKIPALDNVSDDTAIDDAMMNWLNEFIPVAEQNMETVNLYVETYRRNLKGADRHQAMV